MTDGFLAQGDMERALGIEVRPALAPPPHLTSGQTMNSGQILPRLTLLHRDYSFDDQWRGIDLTSGQTMVCGLALGMQRARESTGQGPGRCPGRRRSCQRRPQAGPQARQ